MSSPEQFVAPDPIPTESAPLPQPSDGASATQGNRLWRWLTVGLLLLGVMLTVLFALRATRSFRTFHAERGRPPREATGNIAPWMTIPYIAAAYGVPEIFLYAQLGVDAEGNDRKSLMQIERTYFSGERGLLRDRILAALELYYIDTTVPTPIVPDPESIPQPEIPIPEDQRPDLPVDSNAPRDRQPQPPTPSDAPPDAASSGVAPPNSGGLP